MRLVIALLVCVPLWIFAQEQDSLSVMDADTLTFEEKVAGDFKLHYERTVLSEIDSSFLKLWGKFDPPLQQFFRDVKDTLDQKDRPAYRYLKEYTLTAGVALDSLDLPQPDILHILDIAYRTWKYQGDRAFRQFNAYIRQFLYHNAVYYSPAYQLILQNGNYEIKYNKPASNDLLVQSENPLPVVPVEADAGNETDPVDESSDDWGDDDGWGSSSDDWGSTSSDDSWGSADDGWGDSGDEWGSADESNANDDQLSSQEDEFLNQDTPQQDAMSAALFQTEQTEVVGPYLEITEATFRIQTAFDTVEINDLEGQMMPLSGIFNGQNAVLLWAETGYSEKDITAQVGEFIWNVQGARLKAEKVRLKYPERTPEPVEGHLEYYSKPRRKAEKSSYPLFMSYREQVPLSYGNDQLKVTGGLTIRGDKETTESRYPATSTLEYTKEGAKVLEVISDPFRLGDSSLVAEKAKVWIKQKRDSVVNQQVSIRYDLSENKMVLTRAPEPFQNSPYSASYFDMDFNADLVEWDLEYDSINISTLNARNRLAVTFKSDFYYDEEKLSALSALYNFNPLLVIVHYGSKNSSRKFFAEDVANATGVNERHLRTSMTLLDEQEYIDYRKVTGEITLQDKAIHYYYSLRGKTDFDKLAIASKTSVGVNATIDLTDNELRIKGVERFFISRDPDITIEPKDNTLNMQLGRNFDFGGKVAAGNFEYNGEDFRFNYDSFLISMPTIDSIKFIIETDKKDLRGNTVREEMENEFVESSGTLYINDPKNKSGKKQIPKYPIFNATQGAVVYFTSKKILNGAYDQGLFVNVPPFSLDSVSASEPGSINFDGSFNSSGLLPELDIKLQVMPDYSLGFRRSVPSEGWPIYNEKGHFDGEEVVMNYHGLHGGGTVDYLSGTVSSDSLTFYQDSLVGIVNTARIRNEDINGVDYPDLQAGRSKLNWKAPVDSMYISNLDGPMTMYQSSAKWDGTAILTPGGIYGSGEFRTRGSVINSDMLYFRSDRFAARHADFEIETSVPDKPALAGNDVRLRFDLMNNFATISPEIEGAAALSFPYVEFNSSIPEARWDLTTNKITMQKPQDVDLSKSYFYATKSTMDSLVFNGNKAEYDISKQELTISGVPYVVVADAMIIPSDATIKVGQNANIDRLTNATVVIDTLHKYHRLINSDIAIYGRNNFSGKGTYEFVNTNKDTFNIEFEQFQLLPDPESPDGRLHTVSKGNVREFDNLIISPGMFYKGEAKMYATKPALELNGYVKLDLKTIPNYDTWIQYSSNAEQQEVVFDFDDSRAENGFPLQAGLHFDQSNNALYSTFITEKRDITDSDLFRPSGLLRYSKEKRAYLIEDSLKLIGENFSGKIMSFNEYTSDLVFEGPLNFLDRREQVTLEASGKGFGNLDESEFTFNTFLAFNFDVSSQPLGILTQRMIDIVTSTGAPAGYGDITSLLYKVSELIGEKATKAFDERSLEEYVPLVSMSNELVKSLVFSDVDLKWSDQYTAFYSVGGLGMSNIVRSDVNARIDGFIEINKDAMGGDQVNIFLQPEPAYWYYFGYYDGELKIFSSDDEFNYSVESKSNADKAKIGEFVFRLGEKEQVQQFVDRFRQDYQGIQEPYQLGSPLDMQSSSEFQPGSSPQLPTEVGEEEENEGF